MALKMSLEKRSHELASVALNTTLDNLGLVFLILCTPEPRGESTATQVCNHQ